MRYVAEIKFQAARLRSHGFGCVDALRAKPFSPRAYFILDGDDVVRRRAADLADRWKERLDWYPCIAT
jgi:hypothetical protein